MRHTKRRSRKGSIAKAVELAMAAPQVVATRTARMIAAGVNPGAVDREEFSRMGTEKVQAFWESMFAMGAQVVRANQEYARTASLQWWRLWTTPWWIGAYRPLSQSMMSLPRAAGLVSGPIRSQHQRAMSNLVAAGLAPVHKRATANARRLGRIKYR